MKVGFHVVLTHVIGINLQAAVLQASFVLGMPLTWVLTIKKLWASEPCESREVLVKKKGNTRKNCKFTDEELSTYYTD